MKENKEKKKNKKNRIMTGKVFFLVGNEILVNPESQKNKTFFSFKTQEDVLRGALRLVDELFSKKPQKILYIPFADMKIQKNVFTFFIYMESKKDLYPYHTKYQWRQLDRAPYFLLGELIAHYNGEIYNNGFDKFFRYLHNSILDAREYYDEKIRKKKKEKSQILKEKYSDMLVCEVKPPKGVNKK